MSPGRPATVLIFGHTVVQVWPDSVVTTLADGGQITATPEDTDAYRATAERLGYGSDTLALCREHEVLHSALAAWLGLDASPTMVGVADGLPDSELRGFEEQAVMAIQRYARAAGVDVLRGFQE